MSKLRNQVRDHYDEQSLPANKLASILAQGRAAAARQETNGVIFEQKKRLSFIAVAAAVVAMIASVTWWINRDAGEVSYAALPPRVIDFFNHKPSLLPPIQDKIKLHQFLVAKGAPADFMIPTRLLPLESAACQVVDLDGKNVYLSCYWREATPDRGPQELIHLLVAKTEDFYDQPKTNQPTIQELDGWSFASWTSGHSIYTLATAAPHGTLMPFLSSLEPAEKKWRQPPDPPLHEMDKQMAARYLAIIQTFEMHGLIPKNSGYGIYKAE